MCNAIQQAAEKIRSADAVIVGGGSGLSSAAGYNHYHYNAMYQEHFQEFDDKYGIRSLMKGFYYIYSKPQQQWGFYSRYLDFMRRAPAGQPYRDLYEILNGKEYHILTTNVDMQFDKVFPADRICNFQGSFQYLQCGQPCHDNLYDAQEPVRHMLDSMNDLEVDSDTIPRCPHCGWKMVPWVQDDTFLRGAYWQKSYDRYLQFQKRFYNKRIVLLELGVGDMTPSIIQLPFWEMTANYPDTFLINVNLADTTPPLHLQGKMLNFSMDIQDFLTQLKKELKI